MQVQNFLKFPTALQRVRARCGLAQKVTALTLGIDQAQFCGVEKGRRPPFDDEAITRLAKALRLGDVETDDLKWAARHDRCLRAMREAVATWDEARLVSSVLSASRLLDTPQRSGLYDYLSSLEVSAEQVRTLTLHESSILRYERSVPMT